MEIGAADGGDTEKIINACVADGGQFDYFAFEPDPRNIATIRASPLMQLPQFKLIECAVGNINRLAKLHLSSGITPDKPDMKDHWFSSSVKAPRQHLEIHPWCKFDSRCNVRMMRLDDVCRLYGVGAIDFIWCDIQGTEDLMIDGARVALENTRLFYTEYYDVELYEGQIGFDEILARLPGKWDVVEKWETEVLFENQSMV